MKKIVLGTEVEFKTEWREEEGYYATRTTPFSITTYGYTRDEAERRALKGVGELLAHKQH